MTKSVPHAFPDGGFGVSTRICGHCMDWIRYQLPTFAIGFCENAKSDHYGHLFLTKHPACECYCKRRIVE